MSKKPVVLMILDGYGLNKTHEGNAVYEAKKPVMDRLMKECPFVEGQASGLAVGLPYEKKQVNIISVIVDAPSDWINALSGKLGKIKGISAKVMYSKNGQ